MPSNPPTPFLPTTRREFLSLTGRGIGLLAFSRFAPSFLVNAASAAVPAPEKDRSILVLVQLAGGNDGLNTLVPFSDDNYRRLRPTIGIPRDRVLPLSDALGLHPSCAAMQALFHDGKLGIVQNVGYPNPNHSHFRSTEIWETASASGDFLSTGWIGRYLDNACAGSPADSHDPLAIHVNTLNGEPETFIGGREHPTFGILPGVGGRRESEETRQLLESIASEPGAANGEERFLQHTLMDALVTEGRVQNVLGSYRPETAYPGNPFGASLKNVAALIAGGMPTRVYFVTLNGFDTHVNQADTHARLLTVLSDGLAAFQRDLEAHQLDGQVVTMTFSEFGRRPSENESRGTDHGTAAPLFVMGSRIIGGLHGTAPALDLPANHDVAFSTDFRGVYATMLETWLACPSEPVLNGKFDLISLLRGS
jgi:uncharacterized protein (DUF1501 family)